MTTAANVPSEVEEYLAGVRDALADVPPEERNELLAEVEASLYDTASETGGSVAAQLGPPADFAAELRSAAGLQTAAGSRAPTFRETLNRTLAGPRFRRFVAASRELAPAWWLVRGYLAVAGVALLFGASWSVKHAYVPSIDSAASGLVAIGLACVASLALGVWTRRRGNFRLLAALVNLAVVAAVVPVAEHLADGTPPQIDVVTVPAVIPGLAYDGVPLANVYPYSRDGKLLHDVFLYTSAGAPLNVSTVVPDPNRRVVRTRSGRRVLNVFPIRYFDPGTRIVSHPNAGPKVKPPRLATPALGRR